MTTIIIKIRPQQHNRSHLQSHSSSMHKIRYDLLARSQKYAKTINNGITRLLYQAAYDQIKNIRQEILKPFTSVCIHGSYPELLMPLLRDSGAQCKVAVHSHVMNQGYMKTFGNVEVLDASVPFVTSKQNEAYDLIVSCLETHHYDPGALMSNYKHKLKPDGAIIGCSWVENTLKQLRWAYQLAENQRYGGLSPKIFNFPGIGTLGQSITSSELKMPTIIIRDFELEAQSMVDIISLLQMMGESGSLQGRRKGVYKDLVLAASAIYDSQFKKPNDTVGFSLQMAMYVCWKQHHSQPKPLSRGKVVNNSFFEQIMKDDPGAKIFSISELSEDPKQIPVQEYKQIEAGKNSQKLQPDTKPAEPKQ